MCLYVLLVCCHFVCHERAPYMMGTLKKYYGLLGPKIMIVGLWKDYNFLCQTHCRNPTLAKCGGEAQHLEKLGVGVLRDSRMFGARQKGAKHLALGCS
jgi:hypothetical protein